MDNHEILSEFCIPESELDAALEIGDFGKLGITVEVIGRINGMVVFRKHKKATPEGNFKPEGAKDIRERLLEKQDAEEDATDPNDNPEE
jgi:hypothetical protein